MARNWLVLSWLVLPVLRLLSAAAVVASQQRAQVLGVKSGHSGNPVFQEAGKGLTLRGFLLYSTAIPSFIFLSPIPKCGSGGLAVSEIRAGFLAD